MPFSDNEPPARPEESGDVTLPLETGRRWPGEDARELPPRPSEPSRPGWYQPNNADAAGPAVAPRQGSAPPGGPLLPEGPDGMDGPPPDDDAAVAPRPRRGQRVTRWGRELAETLILAFLIFLAVRSVVQNFRVEGASMEPTLQNGQYLLVNKAIYFRINLKTVHKFLPFIHPGDNPERYLFRAPRRGDIIVFRAPESPGRDFIKRIIGVPGDVVEVRGGVVYVNGEPLKENYIADPPTYQYPPTEVPPRTYWVLGDNRNNSDDSHHWGPVPEGNIIGQAWFGYWPRSDIGFVDNRNIKPGG